jgi:chromosome segregation ATPase
MPTQAELEKQKRLAEKETRLQDMNDYQQAMMNYRWAKLNYTKTKDEKTLQQAEDRGKQAINKLISRQQSEISQIDDQIKELKAPSEDVYGQQQPIDYDAISELETKKLNIQDQIDNLKSEKGMFGAVKEKRTFSPGTGRETSRTPVTTPSVSERTGGIQPRKGGGF